MAALLPFRKAADFLGELLPLSVQAIASTTMKACRRISTGFVESAVNEIIAKRMVKRQHMRWLLACISHRRSFQGVLVKQISLGGCFSGDGVGR
jgi:hypothetical protein